MIYLDTILEILTNKYGGSETSHFNPTHLLHETKYVENIDKIEENVKVLTRHSIEELINLTNTNLSLPVGLYGVRLSVSPKLYFILAVSVIDDVYILHLYPGVALNPEDDKKYGEIFDEVHAIVYGIE